MFIHRMRYAMLWYGFFSSVLAGQIMHRLKLTWLADEGSTGETASTFRVLLYITVVNKLVQLFLKFSRLLLVDENGNVPTTADGDVPTTALIVFEWLNLLSIMFYVFKLVILTKIRKRIRSKYSIPAKDCGNCEDFCCSLWCPCCSLSQMARHTADYETYAARCCSETGLSPNVPSIV